MRCIHASSHGLLSPGLRSWSMCSTSATCLARRRCTSHTPNGSSGSSASSDTCTTTHPPQDGSRFTVMASRSTAEKVASSSSAERAQQHKSSAVLGRGTVNAVHRRGASSANYTLHSLPRFSEPVKRIILMRNGRSAAHDDLKAYVETPDWRIPLTEEGKRQCIATGRELAALVQDEPIYIYYSPYIRSRQSLRFVLQGYDDGRAEKGEAGSSASRPTPLRTDSVAATNIHGDTSLILRHGSGNRIVGVREDVRLRDGDIGRYTDTKDLCTHLEERRQYGSFFYRFPHGESGADVCDRVTSFLDAFQRERVEFPTDTNVVIITHGLNVRLFIKRWFHLTVDTFHTMLPPPPGSICTLTRLHHRSYYRMDEGCVDVLRLPQSLNENNGYRFRNKQLLGSMSCGAPYL